MRIEKRSLILLLSAYLVHADVVEIQPFSFPKNIDEGQRVQTTCAIRKGKGDLSFSWKKDGQPIESNTMWTIYSHEMASMFMINNASVESTGNYTCMVRSASSEDAYTAALIVTGPPKWLKEPTDLAVAAGDNATLECQAYGNPDTSFTWKRSRDDKKTWQDIEDGHMKIETKGTLTFYNIRVTDAGYYNCEVTNGLGTLQKTIVLKVKVAARFEQKFAVHTVKLAETAKLRCDAVGDNPTTITWTYNHQSITQHQSSRYEIFESITDKGTTSELHIHDADRGDNGQYVCVAKNSYGKDERTVKLVVLEVPGSPSDVRTEQTWSQSASVRWTSPYNGNSAITQFIIQYWKDSGTSHRLEEETVSPTQNTMTLHNLHPGTAYIVRVLAINEIGRGSPSESVQFITKEAAPSAPPTDVSVDAKGAGALTIKWKAPPRDQWNGLLKGYYVGYKIQGTSDSYTYKTVDFNKHLEEEYRLSGLKKATEYSVVVQVFNNAGSSPPSHEIIVKTSEKDPPLPPYLWLESRSRSTISLKWDHKSKEEQQEIHYILFYREESGTWTELAVPRDSHNQYSLTNLREGTRYQLYLKAYSEAGQSDSSEMLSVKTEGGALSDSSSYPIHERENDTPVYLRETVIAPIGVSVAIVLLVVFGACLYVRREEKKYRAALASVTDKRYPYGGNHTLPHMSSQRYVDVDKSRPLIRSPLPPPPPSASDTYPAYPAPYATLPLRGGTLDRRRFSEDQQRATFLAQHTLDRKRSTGHVIQETAEVHHYDMAA
ncbi:cell adhesion molecule Dscam1-like isoform X1 [Centruroides vittatus]|uniref:cell adhesion molecule Dscam1-like isoform X1 n=1 Tax=Centruroides vittatus TaxID=120091 RepID=UPI003510C8A1